jgi:medium-chain acyl-[acyl-carrier-protein] hydrolase
VKKPDKRVNQTVLGNREAAKPFASAGAAPSGDLAAMRLFCFPYAGAGTPVFRRWQEGMPENVLIHPIELLGRGAHLASSPSTRMDSLIAFLSDTVAPYLDKRFAFFGHSMGALVAFELAHRLRDLGHQEPVALYVAAQPAPQLLNRQPRMHDLPDAQLRAELRRLGGTPPEVLYNDEFMALLLPTLRADLEVCETYTYTAPAPLSCPIVAYGGAADPDVSEEDLKAWAQHTTGAFAYAMLPGGHFFIDQRRRELLAALSASLALWR